MSSVSPLKKWYEDNKDLMTWKEMTSLDQYQKFKEESDYSATHSSFVRYLFNCKAKKNKIQVEGTSTEDETNLTDTIQGLSREILSRSATIRTAQDLVEFAEIDMDEWVITKQVANKWGSETNPNYQVKVWLSRVTPETASEEVILNTIKRAVLDLKDLPAPPVVVSEINKTGNLLELAIVDHHIDQLDKDLFENKKLSYLQAVCCLFEKAKEYKPETVLLTVGPDFFNSDSKDQMTTKGTPQHDSVDWKRSFKDGLNLMIHTINMLRDKANVHVALVPGNHDFHKSFYLGCALEAIYENDERTTIDNSIDGDKNLRKYFNWGKCLIGMTHKLPRTSIDPVLTMSREAKEYWGSCEHIELHLGHLHKEKQSIKILDEETAIKTRHLPSLTSAGEWEKEMGFKHIRESQALIWNKESGVEAVFHYKEK